MIEILITVLPLAGLWVLMWATLDFGCWIAPLLAIPAAGFLVRTFMIQHDCSHGSFFRHRKANVWTGRLLGVLTLTPFDCWRHQHLVHHATSGNLDRRGTGDIDTLTVEEYLARSFWERLRYRLYRHPLVLFGIGPGYLFILRHRLPLKSLRSWISTMTTNLAIVLVAAGLIWAIGTKVFLFIYIPVVLLAASVGVWLFYVQHQFEHTMWASGQAWSLHEAALHGSSHYELPSVLRWFTANIGVHHVHHLCSRIPYYRLARVLRDYPELRHIGRLTLRGSVRCVRLALWDQSLGTLISFRDLKSRQLMKQTTGATA